MCKVLKVGNGKKMMYLNYRFKSKNKIKFKIKEK